MMFMDARTLKFMEKAMEYSQCKVLADKEALAFLAGAKWADENPEWIDDRVPEKDSGFSLFGKCVIHSRELSSRKAVLYCICRKVLPIFMPLGSS